MNVDKHGAFQTNSTASMWSVGLVDWISIPDRSPLSQTHTYTPSSANNFKRFTDLLKPMLDLQIKNSLFP